MTDQEIFLVPYDPNWPTKFQKEKELLEKTLGKYITGGIYHVGSTSIPGISAKPIIDILIGVESLEKSRPSIDILKDIAYLYAPYKTEYEHWFCKPSPERREFHLHLMPSNSPEFKAKIAFRDYLIDHPEESKKYEALKVKLAREFTEDREAYTQAKTEFVKEIVAKALGRGFKFET